VSDYGCYAARIPVIVITAFPDEHLRARALNAGAVCFLSKPATKEDLLTCIHSALNRQHGDDVQS
jgi:FixJ family two-component response regulator